jgi:hypothetical protein
MAVTEANLLRKIRGANIYFDCTVPSAWTAPTLTAGVPAGGTDIGATIGETTWTYSPNIETVEIEQDTAMIAPHVVSEEMGLQFTIAETTAANLVRALSQTFERTSGSFTVMNLGGNIDVTGRCVAAVAEKSNQPGLYYGAMLYNAYIASEVSIPHKRGEVNQVQVTLAGSSLLTREQGDRLGQYFDQTS